MHFPRGVAGCRPIDGSHGAVTVLIAICPETPASFLTLRNLQLHHGQSVWRCFVVARSAKDASSAWPKSLLRSSNWPTRDETSLSLIARAGQMSDSDSWNQIVVMYEPLLRRWLSAYEVQNADVDDLVREVLTVVASELPAFEHNERCGAFRN